MSKCQWRKLGPPEMYCVLEEHDETRNHMFALTPAGLLYQREQDVVDAAIEWRYGTMDDDDDLMDAIDRLLSERVRQGKDPEGE